MYKYLFQYFGARTDKGCGLERPGNLTVFDEIAFLDREIELARSGLDRAAAHPLGVETAVDTRNHAVEV